METLTALYMRPRVIILQTALSLGILSLAAAREALGEWGGLTLILTPIVQPNIYFLYVNVLETFIIGILGPNKNLDSLRTLPGL